VGEGGRNRTRSEIPNAGNKEDNGGVSGVSTDIRFREGGVKKMEVIPEREKGDRERIKNLEKRRKKNGKLGKEENKTLYDLYKRVKESKKAEAGKSDLNSSDDVNKSFEKAIKNVIVDGKVMNIETSRPSRFVNKVEADGEFDYNSVQSTVVTTGQIDYLNFDYLNLGSKNTVESKANGATSSGFIDYLAPLALGSKSTVGTEANAAKSSGFIDYLAPLAGKAKSTQSSFDDQSDTQYYSASNENSTPESSQSGAIKQKNKKKVRNDRVSTIQDLKLTNKMLLEKCSEISKQFGSTLGENGSNSPSSKLEHVEKMKLKNEKRKLKMKEKKKAKAQQKDKSVSLSESESVQVDSDLLKIAQNYAHVDLCKDAEIKYFSS